MPNNVLLSPGQVLAITCVKQWLKAVSSDVACAIPTAVIQRAADGICREVDNLILNHDEGEEATLTARHLEQAILDGSPYVLWANMGEVRFCGFRLFSPSLEQEAALQAIMGGCDLEASRVPRDVFA